jgi:hypothetical protein
MSQAEKRHFMVQANSFKSEPDYIKLYRLIEKMDHYDEALVKEVFQGKNFIKQLHVMKNYLHNMIMRSMRDFHSEHSKNAELKDIMSNVEILFNKELYALCDTELKRAKRLAIKYEISITLYEIIDWERRVEQARNPQNYHKFEALLKEQQCALQVIDNQYVYTKLILEIAKGIYVNKIGEIDQLELLDSQENAKSFEAIIMHYNSKYFLEVVKGNSGQAERLLYEVVDYLDSMPEMILAYPGYYSSSINNFISYLVFSKKEEQSIILIQKAKTFYERIKIVGENTNLLKQILRTYNLELEIYRNNLSLLDKSHFERVEQFVIKNTYKIPKSYLISFWFQFAVIYFKSDDFNASLKWINEILNYRYAMVRKDLLRFVRILNLMTHYELGNDFVLRYYVDNTRRFFRKHLLITRKDEILLKLFAKLGKTASGDHPMIFRKYFDSLLNYEEDLQGSLVALDYMKWIHQKSSKQLIV